MNKKEEFSELKDNVTQLSDEELDKAAGGAGLCPPHCIYCDNHCSCPEVEDY